LLEQEALQSFLPLCENRGIGIILGGSYNSGILATGPKADSTFNYSTAPKDVIDKVTRIQGVCARHNVPMIEAALQFPLFHPSVVSVIPSGQSVAEVTSNRRFLDADIPKYLWADLKSEGLMRHDAPTP
jgi:D-threo-aldose 1-dehydrogenase